MIDPGIRSRCPTRLTTLTLALRLLGSACQATKSVEEAKMAHLNLLPPGEGPRAPPKRAGLRELSYQPIFDLPVRLPVRGRTQTGRTQTGALPQMERA